MWGGQTSGKTRERKRQCWAEIQELQGLCLQLQSWLWEPHLTEESAAHPATSLPRLVGEEMPGSGLGPALNLLHTHLPIGFSGTPFLMFKPKQVKPLASDLFFRPQPLVWGPKSILQSAVSQRTLLPIPPHLQSLRSVALLLAWSTWLTCMFLHQEASSPGDHRGTWKSPGPCPELVDTS